MITLLQSLVLAPLTTGKSLSEPDRRSIVQRKTRRCGGEPAEKLQEHLFIHFLPPDRAPLLFCVHNAGDDQDATCYLRDGEKVRFYRWSMGQGAFNVASDLRQLQKSEGDAAVFYPTLLYNVSTENEEETVLRDALKRQLDSAFGPLNREVSKRVVLSEREESQHH